MVNVYVPNGSAPDSPKFAYKLEFISQLRNYLESLHVPEKLLILTGDFNIAPEPRDVYDADEMEGEIGFHPEGAGCAGRIEELGFRGCLSPTP